MRGEGHCFADDVGLWNPVGITAFPWLWAWLHDRARLEENVAYLAGKVDYARILCEVGGESWEDRAVDPRAWREQDLADLLDWSYGEHGIRLQLTIFGGLPFSTSRNARRALVDRVVSVVRGREETVFAFEGANEAQDGNFDNLNELRELCRVLQATGIPTAVSCPMGGSEGYQAAATTLYGGKVGTMATYHFDRTLNDENWRPVKQAWDVQFLTDVPPLASSNEPIGPHSSVAALDDPLRLVMSAVVGFGCRVGAYVYHADAGIRMGGAADLGRGRAANYWDVPNIEATLAGLRAVRTILPSDLSNWTPQNSHWPGHPLPPDAIWTDGADHGVVRAYAAVNGERFVVSPIGIKRFVTFTARQACHVDVFDPLTGELLEAHDLGAGRTFRFDQMAAAVIVGRGA